MNNELISVIIPMYNAEKFIGKLLESIKLQTYSNLEIIVIDDGSTDKSLEIANAFAIKDNRINVIASSHEGVGHARNIGLERAKGKYITFLDADDYIEKDMYEKLIKEIIKQNVAIIRCNFVREDVNGKILKTYQNDLLDLSNKKLRENEIRTKLLPYIFENKFPAYMPLVMIKAEFIKNKIKFRTEINFMEDLIFFLELILSVQSMYCYDYKCYHYVNNNNGSTNSRKRLVNNCYDTIKVIHLIEEIFKEYNIDKVLYEKIYYVYASIFITYLLKIFDKNDQYTISYQQMIKMIKEVEIKEIIKKADFSNCQKENIKLIANYIENEQFKKIYTYVQTISI